MGPDSGAIVMAKLPFRPSADADPGLAARALEVLAALDGDDAAAGQGVVRDDRAEVAGGVLVALQ